MAITRVAIDAAKNGTRELIAAQGVGKVIVIYSMSACALAAGTIVFKRGTTALTGTITAATAQQFYWKPDGEIPDLDAALFVLGDNEAFNVTLGTNVDLDGWIKYDVIDV